MTKSPRGFKEAFEIAFKIVKLLQYKERLVDHDIWTILMGSAEHDSLDAAAEARKQIESVVEEAVESLQEEFGV